MLSLALFGLISEYAEMNIGHHPGIVKMFPGSFVNPLESPRITW